jgi:hypothetical protein
MRRRIHEERPQREEVRPPPPPPARGPEAERPEILQLASAMGNRAFSDVVRGTDAKGIGPTLAGEEALVDAHGADLARQPGPLAPLGPAPPGAPGSTMGVTATVAAKIRHTTTPPQMTVDRIPPRVGVPVPITISGWSIPMAPVEVAIENGGGGNGTCTLDGAATTTLMDSGGTPTLVGVDQTAAGRGAQLRVVVRLAGAVLARSNPFAVAAIPQNYSDTKVSELTGARRGLVVQDGWESDSGVFADLDETEISERVEETSASGVLAGLTPVNSGYLPGDKLTQDTHSTPASVLTGPGERIVAQTCMFKDHRTGTTDIPMTNSGYTLTRSCITFGAGTGWFLITTKVGAATTAKGISSQAGAGAAVAFQQA